MAQEFKISGYIHRQKGESISKKRVREIFKSLDCTRHHTFFDPSTVEYIIIELRAFVDPNAYSTCIAYRRNNWDHDTYHLIYRLGMNISIEDVKKNKVFVASPR